MTRHLAPMRSIVCLVLFMGTDLAGAAAKVNVLIAESLIHAKSQAQCLAPDR